MNFFGIGLPELALIFVLALLVFGPKKLPEVGSSLAKALKSFQKAQQDFESELRREAEELKQSVAEPMKASLEKPQPKALEPQAPGVAEATSQGDGTMEVVEVAPVDEAAPVVASEAEGDCPA